MAGRVPFIRITRTVSHRLSSTTTATAAAAVIPRSSLSSDISSSFYKYNHSFRQHQESATVWTRQATLDAATLGARLSISLQIGFLALFILQVPLKNSRPQGPTRLLTPQQQVPPVSTLVALGTTVLPGQHPFSERAPPLPTLNLYILSTPSLDLPLAIFLLASPLLPGPLTNRR